eukprot:CCRYP_004001-RC/>CCRYP_004001-RC protein AED:0.50 eAED:1.00 QI:0/-1/0/1/-1/0/1/0/14
MQIHVESLLVLSTQ